MMTDFKSLNDKLLSHAREIVSDLLPGGKPIGREWTCGDLTGKPGNSCKVNLDTGRWSDFASGTDQGGDLISLYAAIHNVSQPEAAGQLAARYGITQDTPPPPNKTALSARQDFKAVPADFPAPAMEHPEHGLPVSSWAYRDETGQILFYTARYDTPGGKEFFPWSYTGKRWVCKGWPAPRPIYNLNKLAQRPQAPVIICEGEKAADAAEILTGGRYIPTTWPNGSRAVLKSRWDFLSGRKVLIWPDADEPGKQAAEHLSRHLLKICSQVKVLDVSGLAQGYDAADALAEGWDFERFASWARPRVTLIQVNVSTSEDNGEISGSHFALWEKWGIPVSTQGQPIINEDCVLRIFEAVPELSSSIWYDEFYLRYLTRINGTVREWKSVDDITLAVKFQRDYGIRRMTDATINKAIQAWAYPRPHNEPREWMESLTWDGKPRIDRFFPDYMGSEENEYTLAIGRNFWLGMAARIYHPGCQLDNMVILKGPQGGYKSTSLRIIGGKWYASAQESVLSKDFYQTLQGKLLLEIGELDTFDRAEVGTIKRVVATPTDRFRESYGRKVDDYPRQCIFVGTTNEDQPLRDYTGGRRFWPVDCGVINTAAITADREQLFAEAVFRIKRGEEWYIVPQEATRAVQEANRQEDEWESILRDYLSRNTPPYSLTEIAQGCFDIKPEKLDRLTQLRIGRCMRVLGYKKKVIREKDKLYKGWIMEEDAAGIELI